MIDERCEEASLHSDGKESQRDKEHVTSERDMGCDACDCESSDQGAMGAAGREWSRELGALHPSNTFFS